MDTREYAQALLNRFQAPPPSDVLHAAEQQFGEYLRHMLVLHKYSQEVSSDQPIKKIHLLLITRVLDGFVSGAHLLRSRSYNASLNEIRSVLDAVSLMKWLTLCEPALRLYLSNDTPRILREFRTERVRQYLGRTPHDRIYEFLVSYQTHPFYTGREYLLGVALSTPGHLANPQHPHYPALDAVAAAIHLLTYAHTAYELATNFGLSEIVSKDRDRLGRMYLAIEKYLAWVSRKIGRHRTIQIVIDDFRQHFPVLFDARFRVQQQSMHQHFKRLQAAYASGSLAYPLDDATIPSTSTRMRAVRASAVAPEGVRDANTPPMGRARPVGREDTRSVMPRDINIGRPDSAAAAAVGGFSTEAGGLADSLPETLDEPPPVPEGFEFDEADDEISGFFEAPPQTSASSHQPAPAPRSDAAGTPRSDNRTSRTGIKRNRPRPAGEDR